MNDNDLNRVRAIEAIDSMARIINNLTPQDGDKVSKQILGELCNIKSSTRYIETLITGVV
jgi:hypothetical protein